MSDGEARDQSRQGALGITVGFVHFSTISLAPADQVIAAEVARLRI